MKIIAILSFCIFLVGCVDKKSAAYHFEQIRLYELSIRDPENQKQSLGFNYTNPKIDKDFHLDELVKLRELRKRELKFARLRNTKENTMKWMEFVNANSGVLEGIADASGDPGDKILVFTLWYLPIEEKAVDEFVKSYKEKK